MASPTDVARVKRLITQLDTEMKQSEGNIQVVFLQHATAKELATVLTALPGQQSSDPAKKGEAPAISKDVKIMADTETNSLIITASRAEFRELENVIKKLDIPRRMVYLEALIMEVDADSSFNVGVNWMAGGDFHDGTGQMLSGFTDSSKFQIPNEHRHYSCYCGLRRLLRPLWARDFLSVFSSRESRSAASPSRTSAPS